MGCPESTRLSLLLAKCKLQTLQLTWNGFTNPLCIHLTPLTLYHTLGNCPTSVSTCPQSGWSGHCQEKLLKRKQEEKQNNLSIGLRKTAQVIYLKKNTKREIKPTNSHSYKLNNLPGNVKYITISIRQSNLTAKKSLERKKIKIDNEKNPKHKKQSLMEQ